MDKCFICLVEKNLWKKDKEGNRICSKCYSDNIQRKDICNKCKILSSIHKYIDGLPICKSCYGKHFAITEICDKCGEIGPVQKRIDNKPICRKCYKKYYVVKEICSLCGETLPVHIRENDKVICIKCYNKAYVYKKKLCSICQKIGRTYKKNICGKCYEKIRPKGICSKCGNLSIIKSNNNGPVCPKCYIIQKEKRKCIKCEKLKTIYSSNMCRSCYNKIRYANDISFRIRVLIKNRSNSAIKKYMKTGKLSSLKVYGIDVEKIAGYLLPIPTDIDKYHIDHIFPVSSFDLNDPEQLKLAFLPENHQWLEASENLIKGAKYNIEEFEKFKIEMKIKYNL